MRNIQMELLRTFVMVVDLGGLTKAGDVLGRSQSAVSLQIKRLEEFLGCKLLETRGRTVALTEHGETLVVYARQILALNDEALSRFTQASAGGAIRVGIPHDFAVAFLQRMLTQFSRDEPDIPLEIHSDVSSHLLEALRHNRFDLVIAPRRPRAVPGSSGCSGSPRRGATFTCATPSRWSRIRRATPIATA